MPFSTNYSLADRVLHRIAFSAPLVQKSLSELENDLFRDELAPMHSAREVFVTGLPRAGTTLMLELLYGTDEFATYTYREMPFVLAPLLWHRISRPFRQAGMQRERAHGDGVKISFDSPEAFEEVVWLAYLGDRIERDLTLAPLLARDLTTEFREAMQAGVHKVLALARRSGQLRAARYLSKNNANISRIDALSKLFPSAQIVVMFRHPLAHAGSLARQHVRFLREQTADAFSRQYMKWIGHYEFGRNFKPIDFGLASEPPAPAEVDETFWLEYWVAAYRYALLHAHERVLFVDFDRLLSEREPALARLGAALGIDNAAALCDAATRLREPTTRPEPVASTRPALERALALHAELQARAV